MNLTKLSERDHTVALFVGKSGSGKSGAAASFAEKGSVEIMDINRRARGILGCPFLKDLFDKIDIWRVTDSAKDPYDEIATHLEMLEFKSRTNLLGFKTLVIEEATVLTELMLLSSIDLRGSSKKGSKIRGKHQFPTPDDYNYVSSVMRTIFYEYLLTLRCNVIMTAWVVDEYGQNPESPYLPSVVTGQTLNMTRKLAQSVPGMFDEVYLFEKEEEAGTKKVKHKVYFKSQLAKTTIPALANKRVLDITGKSFHTEIQKIIEKGE